MAVNAYVIRFPNGAYEYRTTPYRLPAVGERLSIRGQVFSVIRIRRNGTVSVNVEPVGGERPKE